MGLAIKDLIEQAKATGRCIFIDGEELLTKELPTEIAQASDLCIGNLFSGTVLLESFLSGIPSVFLDLAGLYYEEVYKWGKGKVVFNDLDELFSAIENYRSDVQKRNGFGDLSRWIENRDPFKDGNASLRMGQYIDWLLKAFGQGDDRDTAVSYADKNYRELWGDDKIVNMREDKTL